MIYHYHATLTRTTIEDCEVVIRFETREGEPIEPLVEGFDLLHLIREDQEQLDDLNWQILHYEIGCDGIGRRLGEGEEPAAHIPILTVGSVAPVIKPEFTPLIDGDSDQKVYRNGL